LRRTSPISRRRTARLLLTTHHLRHRHHHLHHSRASATRRLHPPTTKNSRRGSRPGQPVARIHLRLPLHLPPPQPAQPATPLHHRQLHLRLHHCSAGPHDSGPHRQ